MRHLLAALVLLSSLAPTAFAANENCPALDCRPQNDRELYRAIQDWVIATHPSKETIQVCIERLRNMPRCDEQ